MIDKNWHEQVRGGVIFDNIPVDAVCPMVLSKWVKSVRIPSPYNSNFYIGVIAEGFANSLKAHCKDELFVCTMVPFSGSYILYVDPALPDNGFPF